MPPPGAAASQRAEGRRQRRGVRGRSARRWSRPGTSRATCSPPSLADGKGDLWEYGQILLTKYGVGRVEYAAALGSGVRHPGRRHPRRPSPTPRSRSRSTRRSPASTSSSRSRNDGGKVTVWGADPSPTNRAEAEAAAGQEVRVVRHRPEDRHVVHGADVALRRRHRPDRRHLPGERRADPGRRGRRQRDQPRRPGAGGAARVADRRPGAPRPCLRHPHRAARP